MPQHWRNVCIPVVASCVELTRPKSPKVSVKFVEEIVKCHYDITLISFMNSVIVNLGSWASEFNNNFYYNRMYRTHTT